MTAPGRRSLRTLSQLAAGILLVGVVTAAGASQAGSAPKPRGPVFTEPSAFDVSQPLRDLARAHPTGDSAFDEDEEDGEGPDVVGTPKAHEADGAAQTSAPATTISSPLANFEGLRNEDNFTDLRRPREPTGSGG